MAGPGAAPKEPSQRARRNKDSVPSTRLPFSKHDPGPLPRGHVWHQRTVAMWEAWRRSPMASLMTEVDWVYMLDTALMHHTMWEKGRWEYAAEIRLRTAAFGGTPEARLRLRIVWADADDKDARIPQTAPVPASRARYEGLAVAGNVIEMPGLTGEQTDSDGAPA